MQLSTKTKVKTRKTKLSTDTKAKTLKTKMEETTKVRIKKNEGKMLNRCFVGAAGYSAVPNHQDSKMGGSAPFSARKWEGGTKKAFYGHGLTVEKTLPWTLVARIGRRKHIVKKKHPKTFRSLRARLGLSLTLVET